MEQSPENRPGQLQTTMGRKIWKIFTVFVRWVFILLFTFILLGGLYFKAPWKILVLDATLLALLTVVPRKKRKYGWLALGSVALFVTVWVFLPESDTGNWKPYTFYTEVKALNDKYGVPEGENAAPYYEQIEITDFYADQQPHKVIKVNEPFGLDDWEPRGPAKWDPNDTTLYRPWKTEEFPELAAWLETEKIKIAPFWKAVQYDKCWFEISNDPNFIMPSARRCTKIKKTAIIIRRMIQQDLGNNDIKAAVDKSLGLLQSSYHLQQQSALIDNLVGWAIYAMSISTINDIVINHPLDENSMKRLEAHISLFEDDWLQFINRTLDHEDVVYKNILGVFYEVNDKGKVRFTQDTNRISDFDPFNPTRILMGKKSKTSIFWDRRINKLQRFMRFMSYSESIDDIIEIHEDIHSDIRKKLVERDFNYYGPENLWDVIKQGFTLRSLMELGAEIQFCSFESISKIHTRMQSHTKASFIIFELKRYYNQNGQWPKSLDPLRERLPKDTFIDLVNNQDFVYKHCGKSFVLYSVGENGIDEKGRQGFHYKTRERKDDFLYWPNSQRELDTIFPGPQEDEALLPEGDFENFF